MKKLTKRQKIILLSGVAILFLTILVSALLIANRTEKTKDLVSTQKGPSAPPTPPDEKPEEKKLVQERRETITTLERKISTDNIKTNDLLSELKTKHGLTSTETDWKKYLEEAS